MKSIFRPDTHSKISGLLVNFSQCFTKYSGLPATGKLLTFILGNSFAPLGLYPLTGVMELFLVKFQPKVVEEQFP